jgi:hypothetical protein
MSMSMSMFLVCVHGKGPQYGHGHTAWTTVIDMQQGHTTCPWTWTCSIEMKHGHAALKWDMDMQHGDDMDNYRT